MCGRLQHVVEILQQDLLYPVRETTNKAGNSVKY